MKYKNAIEIAFTLIFFSLVYSAYRALNYFKYPIKLPVSQLAYNISNLDLDLTISEKHQLNNIAIFIEDIKKTVSYEDALKIQNSHIYIDSYEDALAVGQAYMVTGPVDIWSDFHIILIGKNYLKNDLYSIDEIKAGVAHEIGHILANHFSFKNNLLHVLQSALSFPNPLFLMGHYLAPYNQRMEFEADKKALELNNEIIPHISSLLEKLEPKDASIDFKVMKLCEDLVRYLQIAHPEPYKQCFSHPSKKERIQALNTHASCYFFKPHRSDQTCNLDVNVSDTVKI